jgi:hypothetical protein
VHDLDELRLIAVLCGDERLPLGNEGSALFRFAQANVFSAEGPVDCEAQMGFARMKDEG